MSLLPFASAAIFASYIALMCYNFGVLPSLSESYYLLEEKKKGNGRLFTLFCFVITLTLLPFWLEHSSEHTEFLAALASFCLVFTGCFAQFKGENKSTHFILALGCALFSLLWMIFSGLYIYPLVIMPIACIVALFNKPNWLFWIEMGSFSSQYSAVFSLH